MTETRALLVERDQSRAIADAYADKKWAFIEGMKARNELAPGCTCGCGDCWSAYIDAAPSPESNA